MYIVPLKLNCIEIEHRIVQVQVWSKLLVEQSITVKAKRSYSSAP